MGKTDRLDKRSILFYLNSPYSIFDFLKNAQCYIAWSRFSPDQLKKLILIICLIPLISQGQTLIPTWKPLPKVVGIPAFTATAPVNSKVHPKKVSFKISEEYTHEKLEFVGEVMPKEIKNLKFNPHPLPDGQIFPLPNGMLFKDNSISNIKYLDMQHGLPDNNILSMTEGEHGLIYLGMANGLCAFNGEEVYLYSNSDEFRFENITGVFFDSQKRLWIAGDQGVAYIQDNKIHIPSDPIFGRVHLKGFSENVKGEVLIFTAYNGVFSLSNGKLFQYLSGLPTAHVSGAHRSEDGKLWLAFGNSGFGFILDSQLYMWKRDGVFNTARSIEEAGDEIWLGVFVGEFLKVRNDSLFNVKLESPSSRVFSLQHNHLGIWFADYGRGIGLIKNNDQLVRFTTREGLSQDRSYCVMIDAFSNVWVGDLSQGISRINENLFYSIETPFEGAVREIEIDSNGNTWYFTEGGHSVKEDALGFTEYQGGGYYRSDGLIDDDKVWFSGTDLGLVKMENNSYTFYHMKENFTLDSTIYSIQRDNSGGIWGYDLANQMFKFQEDSFYNYSKSKEWQDFEFTGTTKLSNGAILGLTKKHGIIEIKDDSYAILNSENGLISNSIKEVFEDEDGSMWFCFDGGIQLVSTDGKSSRIDLDLLKTNPISNVLRFSDDHYIAVTSNGIIILKKNNQMWEHKFYGKESGLHMVGHNFVKRKANGDILIGGNGGLIRFDPYFLNTNPTPPQLSLNRVLVEDSTILFQESAFEINQNQPISFIFNNIYWGGKSTLNYLLSYDGNEGNWRTVSSNTVSLEGLNYGKYQLSVTAKGDNKTSEPLHFSFVVRPYWYQTIQFRITALAIIIISIVAYFFYREKRSRIAKQKLQNLVDIRTQELQAEKNEVSKQLAEKEILMQEIHHRVKNNLTFLKSLLYLRAKSSNDKEIKRVLDECQARIQSVALVHHNLYDVEDATKVNFKTFLNELFVELVSMFEQDLSQIEMDVNVDDIKIDMKTSVFLGLILNELITNSFKYAFKEDSGGKITIGLKEVKKQYELSYIDSGDGLPETFDFKSSGGFGFRLLRILLSQMNAEMTYGHRAKNVFTITIPK